MSFKPTEKLKKRQGARYSDADWDTMCFWLEEMQDTGRTNFRAQLMRLMMKADTHNFNLLQDAFPIEGNLVAWFRSGEIEEA